MEVRYIEKNCIRSSRVEVTEDDIFFIWGESRGRNARHRKLQYGVQTISEHNNKDKDLTETYAGKNEIH